MRETKPEGERGVTSLEWHENPEGISSGEYRIRHIEKGPRSQWSLEIGGERTLGWNANLPNASFYKTLGGAKGAALRAARAQFLRDTLMGHAVVGLATLVAFVALLPVIESVVAFVAAVLALYVGLRSLTFAISIKLGDAWGWTRDDGVAVPPGLSDRVVRAGISWLRRRREAAADTPHSGAVRVLPVEPPW